MKREECLDKAMSIVSGDRYGAPEDNFRLIGNLWEIYIREKCVDAGAGVSVMPEDVAAMMALLKLGRISAGTASADSWVDLAGYAACGCELETEDSVV
ncbi:MAG: DUF6378 domain-containing protein [Oscillospiraceae bacterium]|nr:DUF6378 domain-containing protein [Oscillospiraceae bacterium]